MTEQSVEYGIKGEDAPEIEIVDDTPEEDRGRKPMTEPPKEFTDDEIASYNESVQKRIKHFTKGYHEERRAKEAALREREEAAKLLQAMMEENKRLKSTVSQNQEALLEQAKKATQVELDKAKDDYKKAYDLGDTDALVAAQESLTAAKIRADRVANFKLQPLQEDTPALKREEEPPRYDPKTENWIARNQWYGQDSRMTAYVLGLDQHLKNSGTVQVGSDEYWNAIDSEMRLRFPEHFEPSDAQPPRKTVVAPATRSTAPKKIVLTQSQVNVARRLGVPLEAYAAQVAELKRSV